MSNKFSRGSCIQQTQTEHGSRFFCKIIVFLFSINDQLGNQYQWLVLWFVKSSFFLWLSLGYRKKVKGARVYNDSEVQIGVSKKGGPKLIVDGYAHRRKATQGASIYWTCVAIDCPGRAISRHGTHWISISHICDTQNKFESSFLQPMAHDWISSLS